MLFPHPWLRPPEGVRAWYPMVVGSSSEMDTSIMDDASISAEVSQPLKGETGDEGE